MTERRKIISALILTTMIVPVLATSAASGDYAVGWEAPFLVENDNYYSAYESHCAMNERGDIVVAWKQSNGSGSNLYSRLYLVGEGWSEAEVVEYTPTYVKMEDVAIDNAGNAFVVWTQFNETTTFEDMWSNRYVRGVGWTGPEPIEDDGTVASNPIDVLMVDGGYAAVVWTSYVPPKRVMISEYEVGIGWSEPSVLDDGDTADAYSPSLDADGEGNVIVVWCQSESPENSIWSKRYEPSSGWGDAEKVADYAYSASPVIAVGDGGNAMCVWRHYNDTSGFDEVRSCAYEAGVGWDAPVLLTIVAYADDFDPVVDVDRDGNALAAWWKYSLSFDEGVYSRAYDVGVGWGDPVVVAYSDPGALSYPEVEVAMTDEGEALLIFLHDDGVFQDVRGTVYNPTGGWAPSVQLNMDGLGDVGGIKLAIDGNGNGFALWAQVDSARSDVWAARYLAPDETPPSVVIESPEDGSTVDSSTISVTGLTEPGVYLTVNGIVAAVEDDGSFACNIAIAEGENTVTATATDQAGNSASVSITVTYEVAENTLEDDLDDAVAELDEMKEELNSTRDDLTDALEGLEDADSRIDSLSAQMMALMIVAGLLAVLSVAMIVMSLALRKKLDGNRAGPEQETPPPPE
jgi:flagellin-like hook-associated protein FlgL